MAYADLSTEEKEAVQALSAVIRPLAGEFGRLLEKFQAVVAGYSGNVETILGELQNGDVIPNETDLAGAQDWTKADYVNLAGYMITASVTADASPGSYNTNFHRSLYAKACGPVNLIVDS